MDRLKQDGLNSFSPQVHRWKPDGSGTRKHLCRLLPGYVFIESKKEPDWHTLRGIPGVLRILAYPDGTHALRGSDTDFITWLKHFDSVIEVSLVVQEGAKVQFVEGPLKNMNGYVVKVNKKRRVAAVQFGEGEGMFQTIWCSFDYVQSCADASGVMVKYE